MLFNVVNEKGLADYNLAPFRFTPIPCAFLNYGPFGGSFHCATLDVRRRGALQSYF